MATFLIRQEKRRFFCSILNGNLTSKQLRQNIRKYRVSSKNSIECNLELEHLNDLFLTSGNPSGTVIHPFLSEQVTHSSEHKFQFCAVS